MFIPDAIDAYLAEQATIGLSENTVYCQSGYLRRFGKVAAELAREREKRSPVKVGEIDSELIARYFATCQGGQGNRNNMLIPLRKFLRWAELTEILRPGAADRLLVNRKNKKANRAPKHYVPPEQFGTLLDVAGQRHPEDRAVMAIALYTLVRRSEITGLRLKHVDLREGVIHVWRQKRQRWTDIGICPELEAELGSWLHWLATHLGYDTIGNLTAKQPDWHVIPRLVPYYNRNARGQIQTLAGFELDPLDYPEHLERVVKRGLDVTGAKTADGKVVRHLGEGMHTIRRSGARAMLDHLSRDLGQDRALVQVATMLDHEDTHQTLAYIGMDQEREQLNNWLKSNSMYGTAVPRLRAVG